MKTFTEIAAGTYNGTIIVLAKAIEAWASEVDHELRGLRKEIEDLKTTKKKTRTSKKDSDVDKK